MDILVTRDITKVFGKFRAVDSVNITVAVGEVFALLGPNGAGKSTLLKMLTTLLPPTSGDAFIDGASIRSAPNKVRKCIGYVPQMIAADGSLTGYENLRIFAKLYDIPGKEVKKRVDEALSFMGLTDSANRLVKNYSGGMIRKLEIAQAMLHHPKLMFLDEPTVGLDPIARKTVWDHIMELRKEYGTTIVMTTHLMEEADEMSNRVALMSKGKVVITDTPERLKGSLNKPGATLEDVFIYYAGGQEQEEGGIRNISRERRTSGRLG
jgi:ABC-2 type transport system ATP-binding protein